MENFTYPHEKHSRPLSVRIPASIKSVGEIAEKYALNPDRLRVMLHQFFLCYLKNERLRKSKSGANYLDEYFPVSSQLLRRTCTDNYKLYVDALIEAGIIECNVNKMGGKSYLPGSHAQLYRWLGISPYAFRSETITERAVIKSVLRTRDMYAKKCKEIAFELSDDNQVYSYMLACCNEVVLPDLHSRKEIESDLGVLEVEAFLTGNLNWFKVDSFGRRLHTPVSSMLKKTRKQLRFKSHPDTELVTLDIRNSQPFFSSVFMSKNLILTHLPEFTPIIPLIEDYERKPDFRLYRRLCVEGRLYEFLLESIGENPNDQIARDKVKELFFSAVLFSRTRVFGEQSRFREHFRRAFPSVHDMFQLIKKLDTDTLPLLDDIIRPTGKRFKYAKSNDSYKLIACLLQRSESAMVYKVIAPKLMSAGVLFLTVHDSFIVLPGDAEFIQEAIKQSFEELSLPADCEDTLSQKYFKKTFTDVQFRFYSFVIEVWNIYYLHRVTKCSLAAWKNRLNRIIPFESLMPLWTNSI